MFFDVVITVMAIVFLLTGIASLYMGLRDE